MVALLLAFPRHIMCIARSLDSLSTFLSAHSCVHLRVTFTFLRIYHTNRWIRIKFIFSLHMLTPSVHPTCYCCSELFSSDLFVVDVV